jgi:hypothetical protein
MTNADSKRRWRQKNPERQREIKRRWRAKHREQINKYHRYYRKNRKIESPQIEIKPIPEAFKTPPSVVSTGT